MSNENLSTSEIWFYRAVKDKTYYLLNPHTTTVSIPNNLYFCSPLKQRKNNLNFDKLLWVPECFYLNKKKKNVNLHTHTVDIGSVKINHYKFSVLMSFSFHWYFQMMNTYVFPNFTAYKEPKTDTACAALSNKFRNAALAVQSSYSLILLSTALIYLH